ncbi:MAG TPA: hypothetical protein VHO50_03665 [Bacteroidales bacterium]|nr:hypothetical protein [Bacteroidales bacterium]
MGENFHYFNASKYRIGLYARYSLFSEKRLQVFAEASPYLVHYKREWASSSDHTPFTTNKIRYYLAPGVSLYSKSKRISFDLYYKFYEDLLTDKIKSVVSYKVNFNF